MVRSRPWLSIIIGESVVPRYLPLTNFVILYTFPCSPLLAASSSWLPRFSTYAHLSAVIILFTVLLRASLFQPFRLGLQDFPLRGSPVLNGLPSICWDPLLPLLLLMSQANFIGLGVCYFDLVQHGVDSSRVWLGMVLSICQCLELVLQLKDLNHFFEIRRFRAVKWAIAFVILVRIASYSCKLTNHMVRTDFAI